MDIPSVLTKSFNWNGALIGYKDETTFFPKDGAHWDLVEASIASHKTIVKDPVFENLVEIRDSDKQLRGYRWCGMFIPNDKRNQLFIKIKTSIKEGKSVPIKDQITYVKPEEKVAVIKFCFFLEGGWPNLNSSVNFSHEYCISSGERHIKFDIKISNVNMNIDHNILSSFLLDQGIRLFDDPAIDNNFINISSLKGYIEIEFSVKTLRTLFKIIKKNYPHMYHQDSITNLLEQEMLESGRKPKEGPREIWLIQHAHLLFNRVAAEFVNKIIDDYPCGFEECKPRYVKGTVQKNKTLVVHTLANGKTRLGVVSMFGSGDRHSFDIAEDFKINGNFYWNLYKKILDRLNNAMVMDAVILLHSFIESRLKNLFREIYGERANFLITKYLEYFIDNFKKQIKKIQSENKDVSPNIFLKAGYTLHDIDDFLLYLNKLEKLNLYRRNYIHGLIISKNNEVKWQYPDFSRSLEEIEAEELVRDLANSICWPRGHQNTEIALINQSTIIRNHRVT